MEMDGDRPEPRSPNEKADEHEVRPLSLRAHRRVARDPSARWRMGSGPRAAPRLPADGLGTHPPRQWKHMTPASSGRVPDGVSHFVLFVTVRSTQKLFEPSR